MVVLDVKLDNILIFNDFSLNLTYPKKIVNSMIPEEHLPGIPNFRYKKLVIFMGGNATGKTALGKALLGIFNFIAKREYAAIVPLIEDPKMEATFSVELAFPDIQRLYRISARFKAGSSKRVEYTSGDVSVDVKSEKIQQNDNYERCVERLNTAETTQYDSYIQALESVPYLTWQFVLPFASNGKQSIIDPVVPAMYTAMLEKILQSLDPRIENVEKIRDADNTYIIRYKNHFVLIKDGLVMEPGKLSSGTAEGIGIADLITAMQSKTIEFFFCDEKFSHVHSAVEKAFLSILIDMIGTGQQLFFTTHNSDVLEMNLPLHSFAFLRSDEFMDNEVSCVFASDFLKKNTASLKNAVENDLFSATPDTDRVFGICDSARGGNP